MSRLLSCPQGHRWQSAADDPAPPGGQCPVCTAPAATSAALGKLCAELKQAAGPNLAGLILYGGLARGRYHPGTSDINLVVLLKEATAASLAAVAPALRAAWRAVRVEPLILVPEDVPRAAVVFPSKLLDIKTHHVVLNGDDPFTGLEISRASLRARLEEAFRNLALRLRRRYVALAQDPAAVASMLANMARPFALDLAALVRLAGKSVPAEDRTVDLFATAAAAFSLDGAALGRLAQLRRDRQPADDLPALFTSVLGIVTRAADIVHEMKEPGA